MRSTALRPPPSKSISVSPRVLRSQAARRGRREPAARRPRPVPSSRARSSPAAARQGWSPSRPASGRSAARPVSISSLRAKSEASPLQRIQQQPLVGIGHGAVAEATRGSGTPCPPSAVSCAASGTLASKLQVDALVGLDAQRQHVGRRTACPAAGEHQVRRALELDDDLAGLCGQRLAGAQVERHALPAPVVDVQLAARRRWRSASRAPRPGSSR